MTRPLPAPAPVPSDDGAAGEPPVGGGGAPAADPIAALTAEVQALTRQNAALLAGQEALRAQLAEIEAHAHLVGHLVQQLHAARKPPLELPLPLARLKDLLVAPGPSLAYLKEMARLAIVTSTRLRQDASGSWHLHRRPAAAARTIGRDLSALMLGSRGVVYRVRQRHASVGARPRVLHVIPNVFVGGSTQLVVDLHERLGHRYEMQVVTAALPPQGRHEGMVLHHLPLGTPESSFAALLDAVKPEIVHLHYWGESDRPWYEAGLAAAAAREVAILQNVNTPVAPLRHPRIHAYLFVSDYIRTTFAPDIANGEVIYPGIDLDRFRPPQSWAPGAADSIGMVYRLTRDKLDDASIEPLIDVALRRPRTRIVVVGEGDLLPVYHARVKEAGVRRNFEFTGLVPFETLPQVYREFRVFAAPVVRESFGQVTPFAMAIGQAVAGFRTGALPEILGSEETLGASRAELAARLLGLLDDPERLERLARANMARAARFSLDGMIGAYAGVYARALGRDPDPMPGFPPAQIFPQL